MLKIPKRVKNSDNLQEIKEFLISEKINETEK